MTGWLEIDKPWLEIDQFPEIILDKIDFLDIIEECGVEYWECSAGEFTHRMRCPLPIHDFGGERTASFYINRNKNNFYCFGCNSHGTTIDFVSRIKGLPFHEALKFLYNFADISEADLNDETRLPKVHGKKPEDMVETYVFKSGVLIRKYLEKIKDTDEYDKKKLRADNKQYPILDSYLDQDNVIAARKYYEKLVDFLKGKI